MDFVYICKDGVNEELKYSIRSVVESFPETNIWVVGGKPDWYTGNYIKVEQKESKYKNAVKNLETICLAQEISESFILMNDDFYIIKKIDGNSQYTRKLSGTYKKLKALGFENPLDYELHVPMIMEKEKLKIVLELLDQFLWRSIYGNKFDVGGTQMEDVKVYNSGPLVLKSYNLNIDDHTYLSSADSSFNSIFNFIIDRYILINCLR
jgi:hypothetical protein